MKKDQGIKIIIPKGMDPLEADMQLLKALNHHANGGVHSQESFDDPAMVDLSEKVITAHERMYADMLEEIFEVLDPEYNGN